MESETLQDEMGEGYFTGVSRDSDGPSSIPPAERDSLFAQFTKRTSTGGGVSPVSGSAACGTEKKKHAGDRFGVCTASNCKNKACNSDGHCLMHSTNKKQHLVQESKLAKLLGRTSLDFVQINCHHSSFKFESRIDSWPDVDPAELIERFKKQERMELGEAMALVDRAREIMSHESNVLRLEAPVIAVGDIHGQFYDLLNMLQVGGDPLIAGASQRYLFLGDYVDRGSFSCEVMLTLLTYKVANPEKIWLIRGNVGHNYSIIVRVLSFSPPSVCQHECASVSGHFGFKEECKKKYGVQLYYRFLLLFQTMPLAALVSTAYGDIFACHGGLSPELLTIEELDAIDRFIEPEENSALLDVLWSDPVSEERVDDMTDEEYEEFISLEWLPNPTRGCSHCFGYKAVHDFLNRNSIVSLVRAHEVQENGFQKHFDPAVIEARILQSAKYKRRMSNNVTALRRMKSIEGGSNNAQEAEAEAWHYPSHDIPTVITVFSAPNYCDRYDNQGAILKIDMALDGFQFLQYSCVPHPVPDVIESQMTTQIMSVIRTCPYMPTSFKDFVRVAIELGPEDDLIEEGIEEEGECEGNDDIFTPKKKSLLTGLFNSVQGSEGSGSGQAAVNRTPFYSSASYSPPRSPPPSSLTPPAPPAAADTLPQVMNRTSSMSSVPFANTVSARSDSSPPRAKKGGDIVGITSPSLTIKRHNSMKPLRNRRASETLGSLASHTSYTSPYLQAHASDAINELHPGRVKKYMDNFQTTSSGESDIQERKPVDTEEDDVDFQKRITELIEQFDRQAAINTKKFLCATTSGSALQPRLSLDEPSVQRSPRRSASLNFGLSSPSLTGRSGERKQKNKPCSSTSDKEIVGLTRVQDTGEDEGALFEEVSVSPPVQTA